ncbi:MAG: thioredoxin family protein [Amphiplicatus sp.]
MLTRAACPACSTVNRIASGKSLHVGKCGKCGASLSLDAPVDADDRAFARHIEATDGPVLVDVWAPWCGPCRMMAPEFEAAAKALQGEMRFLKLNADENQTASRLGVRGIPALILFHHGKEVGRRAGLASRSDIVSWARSEIAALA